MSTAGMLREAMARKGDGYTAAAASMGVTLQTVRRWAQGKPIKPANQATFARYVDKPLREVVAALTQNEDVGDEAALDIINAITARLDLIEGKATIADAELSALKDDIGKVKTAVIQLQADLRRPR